MAGQPQQEQQVPEKMRNELLGKNEKKVSSSNSNQKNWFLNLLSILSCFWIVTHVIKILKFLFWRDIKSEKKMKVNIKTELENDKTNTQTTESLSKVNSEKLPADELPVDVKKEVNQETFVKERIDAVKSNDARTGLLP